MQYNAVLKQTKANSKQTSVKLLNDKQTINACVAYGGWVPRNLGAEAADPKPR